MGPGALAGQGARAGRRFATGEVAIGYELRRLTRQEYRELSEIDRRRGLARRRRADRGLLKVIEGNGQLVYRHASNAGWHARVPPTTNNTQSLETPCLRNRDNSKRSAGDFCARVLRTEIKRKSAVLCVSSGWHTRLLALVGKEEVDQLVGHGVWVRHGAQMSGALDLDDAAVRYMFLDETVRLPEVVTSSRTLEEGERNTDPRQRGKISGTIELRKLLYA